MSYNRNKCWFCGPTPNSQIQRDDRPLCDGCQTQLSDFQTWLKTAMNGSAEVRWMADNA